MDLAAYTALERLVFGGFIVTALLWVAASGLVVFSRLLHDLRRRRLTEIALALTDPGVASLSPLDRSPAIRRVLDLRSRRVVYHMVTRTDLPSWVTEACAEYSLEYLGMPRMLRDAYNTRRWRKWRRISALFALGHIRAPGTHAALAVAIRDPDAEVSAAAATILHRLGDRAAAEILVSQLRVATRSLSRVATYLDSFPIPVDDLLQPLLTDSRPAARYWAASLLCNPPHPPSLATQVEALTDDPDAGVRQAALATLGAIGGAAAMPAARRRLTDADAHVRSTALRLIGTQGGKEPEHVRHTFASWITASMGDGDWDVRRTAKEALVKLGPIVQRQVAAQLRSSDAFVRDGAAEVMQNMGIADWEEVITQRLSLYRTSERPA